MYKWHVMWVQGWRGEGRKDGGREITSSQGRTREALAAWPPWEMGREGNRTGKWAELLCLGVQGVPSVPCTRALGWGGEWERGRPEKARLFLKLHTGATGASRGLGGGRFRQRAQHKQWHWGQGLTCTTCNGPHFVLHALGKFSNLIFTMRKIVIPILQMRKLSAKGQSNVSEVTGHTRQQGFELRSVWLQNPHFTASCWLTRMGQLVMYFGNIKWKTYFLKRLDKIDKLLASMSKT